MSVARATAEGPAHPPSRRATTLARAAIAVLGPLVFLAGMVYHPVLSDITDAAVIAEAINADPARWATAHLAVAVGFAFLALAFLALRSFLHEKGEDRWSRLGTPLVVFACAMFVILPTLELAPLAAAQSGGDARAVQLATEAWFMPVWVIGSVLYALGVLAFSVALVRSRVLGTTLTWLVIGALLVTALARTTASWNLVVWGLAPVAAFWPLAYAMLKRPTASPSRARRGAAA